MEPADAPMLKRPPARPRSLAGNHSAVAFIPAGLALPSAKPSSPRSTANAGQLLRQAVRHADERPRDREHREPELQPDDVEDVAADRLQHDGELERADDPRVLLRGDVQVLEDGRRGDAERASGEIVDDRPDHQQRHHPPAQRCHLTAAVSVAVSVLIGRSFSSRNRAQKSVAPPALTIAARITFAPWFNVSRFETPSSITAWRSL